MPDVDRVHQAQVAGVHGLSPGPGMTTAETSVPDGQLTVTEHRDGRGYRWYLVSIGRQRYVKRFNLSEAEARLLVAELEAALPSARA